MQLFLKYFEQSKLVLLLIGLFVVQNQIFNLSVHFFYNPYFRIFLMESLTLGVLLYGPAIFFKKKFRYIYLSIISIFISLLFSSQYIYYSFYGGFFQTSVFEYMGQASAEWSTILTLLNPIILLFFLNIIVVLRAYILERKEEYHSVSLKRSEKAFAAAAIIAIAGFGYIFLLFNDGGGLQKIKNPIQTLQGLGSFTFSPNYFVQKVGIGNYFISNIIGSALRDKHISVADKTFAIDWFSQKPKEPDTKYFGLEKGKNLFFIQVESLESAVIGQKIGDQEITPNLNKLSKIGLYFDNYYTQVSQGNTADAEFVTLNSLYPLSNEVAFIDYPHNTYDSLPNLLVKNGYNTYSLHGDVANFWNRANIYPSLGYENTISKNDFVVNEDGFETLSDDDFFSQSVEKLKTFPQPFMATLITLSSHTPFVIPAEYQKIVFPPSSTLSERQKNYIESVHYTDNAIGNFINELKKNGLYDNSLIAIYGDHGSSTNISQQLGTQTNNKIPESLISSRVPLILLSPKLNASIHGSKSTPGSHLDLYPTVALLLGINPPKSILGQDLLNTKTPLVVRRDPYSQGITAILTPKLSYEGAINGVFENGTCLKLPTGQILPIGNCKKLYDEQPSTIKASDLVIKGNLIPNI